MKLTLATIAALALTLSACGKKAETPAPKTVENPTITATPVPVAGVTVASITLGNAINTQMQVVTASDTFAKGDTIYASVNTTGTGSSTLKAKWTYSANGQDVLVNESTQAITTTGPANSEFHVSKPDGWPNGEYKVEISASGNAATTRTFTVK
jgi:energy-converting hydrogenase Eha subunit A